MATGSESVGLSVNEVAIVEAVKKAAEKHGQGMSNELIDAIARDAVECIADEQVHELSRININQVINSRIEALATFAAEQGFEA